MPPTTPAFGGSVERRGDRFVVHVVIAGRRSSIMLPKGTSEARAREAARALAEQAARSIRIVHVAEGVH